ncbi:glycoside hydrolase family 6 protein [Nonomuraea sp. NPDC002799]
MRFRAGTTAASAAILTVTAAFLTVTATVLPQAASAATQLIANGAFTGSTTPWTAIGQTTVAAESGRMRVNVTSVVANPWDAMVAAPTTAALNPGKSYTLSFDAYATTAFQARATVQYVATPSSNQSLATGVQLTTASKRYSIPFVAAAATSTAAEVTFQLGGSGGAPVVRFDNVSLLETQTTRPTALYVSSLSNPAKWATANPGTTADAINAHIASKPIFEWFGGWFGDLTLAVDTYVGAAQAQDRLPMLVAYNIPNRDACAGQSGGGAGDAAGYHAWITAFAQAIGTRHALVVLEPDAVPAAECLRAQGKNPDDQYAILLDATQVLRAQAPNAWVYLDAGNATWIQPPDLAPILVKSGIAHTRGFSVNVSNYLTTGVSTTYADEVNGYLTATVGAKKYVIDTSRNGNGPYTDATPQDNWCNPPNRKLGVAPTRQTSGAEYLLWVKVPGDSDGQCGIAPPQTPAGTFSPYLAEALINGTS